jgi:hypothetical protein
MHYVTVAALFFITAFIACGDDKSINPETGSLTITSEPSCAGIFFKENYTKYITPHTFTGLEENTYTIKLKLQYHEDWDSLVVVKKDQMTTVHATLLSTAGSIKVNSEPTNASIYIDHTLYGVTPHTIQHVSIGNHEIKLTLKNYADWIDTVHVGRDSTTTVEATLLKLIGRLNITSEPSGASVWLDGTELGITTPAAIDSLLATTHQLKLTLTDYQDYEQDVTIIAFDTVDVRVTLLYEVGNLSVNSNPQGASIWLDGENTEFTTPHTFTYLETGNHQVKLVLSGYRDWVTDLVIEANQTTDVNVQLEVLYGSLHVSSTPAGALVWIDGFNIGQITPVIIDSLAATVHQLKLTLLDYQDYEQEVTIILDDTVYVDATLIHEVGNIYVDSDPQGTHITLNGVSMGFTTPYKLTDVLTGTHQLSLSLYGYTTWSQLVLVEANKTTEVFADLVSIYGKIAVSSSPPSAAIQLDGVNTGLVTPDILVDLNPGAYHVKLTLPAYLDYEEDVTVVAGQTSIVDVQFIQAPTLLIIESYPSGAEIWINGNPTGNYTPDTLIDVAPGSYQVRTLYPGHFPADTTITVETGYTHIASLIHDPASDHLITYTIADTIWITELDGINPQVLAVDYDSWISAYVSYPGGMLWSPDGEYLVYTGLTNPVSIITSEGTLEAGLNGSRSMDFDWSHNSRYLVYGWYRSGIYWYDLQTNEYKRIMGTWCYCWDHCPVYAPGDSIIAFIHQEYGRNAYLYLMNGSGTNVHRVSHKFGTGFDEDINLTRINDQQLVYETGSGLYLLDLADYSDTTLISPTQLVADNVSLMRISKNKEQFAYMSSTGLHYGIVGNWTPSWLIKYPSLYDFAWSLNNDAIACRTGDGLHWLLLDGTDYHIINDLSAGRGAVDTKP